MTEAQLTEKAAAKAARRAQKKAERKVLQRLHDCAHVMWMCVHKCSCWWQLSISHLMPTFECSRQSRRQSDQCCVSVAWTSQ